MKAVVLSAGKGTRIHPLTNGSPKSLLPLGNTTLLGKSLTHLREHGIDDLIIVTGYKRDCVAEYVYSVWDAKLQIVFNPHYESTNVLYSFWLALPWIGNDDFIFLHADTVFAPEVLSRLLEHREAPMVFAIDRHPCDEEAMKVRILDNRLTMITKQMPPNTASGEFVGLARVSGSQIEGLRRNAERLFEEGTFNAFFELAVQRMIDGEDLKVQIVDISGLPWREIDFPEDYADAKALFESNN